MNVNGTDVKEIFNSYFLNQKMLSLSVPIGGPSCTVNTTDLKFILFSFCVHGWPPVYIACIQLLCLCWNSNSFTCSVKSKPVKQEVSPYRDTSPYDDCSLRWSYKATHQRHLLITTWTWNGRVERSKKHDWSINCMIGLSNNTLRMFVDIYILNNLLYNSL